MQVAPVNIHTVQNKVDARSGVYNLLVNCAGARRGQRLLVAYEAEQFGYFSADVLWDVVDGAEQLGLKVSTVDVGYAPQRSCLPKDVSERLAEFDVVLFLSRLGDQLRFSELPEGPRFVVCFALNSALMASSFGTADYRAFLAAKQAVDRALCKAETVTLTCPSGTMVTGRVPEDAGPCQDTTSMRFPLSVFSPVPAREFSGYVALGGFLTGTGSQYYDDYTVEFDGPLFAMLEAGRLVGFEGDKRDVDKANAHYDRVSRAFGIDRDFVHSWHAGIHPGCGFPWNIRENYEKWGGAAFGNPRILHFHTCGAYAPGEISWNVFDPTISVDGVNVWENGRFRPELLEEGPEMLAQYPCAARAFANPDLNIGFLEH